MIIYGASRSIQSLITAGSATIVSVNEATKQCYCNGQKVYAAVASIFGVQFFLVAASVPSSFSLFFTNDRSKRERERKREEEKSFS